MALYLIMNKFDLCHGYICGHLTSNTKNILWMNDFVLIMT